MDGVKTGGREPLVRVDGLRWESGGRRRGVTPDPLAVRSGQTAVLVAGDAVEADLVADFLVGLSWRHDGVIAIGGQRVTQETWEREIGLVPAGAGLLPHLTVEKNLVLTAVDRRARASVRGRVAYMARRMQIEGFLRARPHELAHDERLAVALTRVLCRHRPVKLVVVEDRAGYGPCHAAVSAALSADPDLAVLVITDDRTRVASLAPPELFWRAADRQEPEGAADAES
ncbi:ATP-binding cassette domain-containing protein [Nonomuraea sp. NPDC048826]|uniref:ATP-binding cassette domain-containing protein n=1 Tax=Nonomuraea sp. NPDC048826 TaxID=3364347 RepID=UPI003716FFE2